MKKLSFFLLYLLFFPWLSSAQDHLPVYVSFEIDSIIPGEFPIFSASVNKQDVLIRWSKPTELNISGFEMERRPASFGDWMKIGYVEGSGTTSHSSYYEFWDYNVPVGSYAYRYKQFDSNGSFSYSQTLEIDISPPDEFVLYQNYPNPFNPVTKISWQSPVGSWQTLKVFDVLGREVVTLVDEYRDAGYNEVEFQSSVGSLQLAGGIYFYQLKAGSFVETKKMILIR